MVEKCKQFQYRQMIDDIQSAALGFNGGEDFKEIMVDLSNKAYGKKVKKTGFMDINLF